MDTERTTAIGLMSGTSMDGIDLAVVSTDGRDAIERGPSRFFAYDAAFRRNIEAGLEAAKAIGERHERPAELAALEAAITDRHAEAVLAFLDETGRSLEPSLVGFHGQTVLHRPERGLTVQLGDGQRLADRLGLPVVYDLRANDMLHGGQGAPLVPAYHAALAHSLPAGSGRFPVAFVNIGGISNVTFVPEKGDPIAFDTGPGNALIDQWMAREGGLPFDADGRVASEGGVVGRIVEAYLDNPFFTRAGPKSLDRGDFRLAGVEGLELSDGARTLARVSAEAIARAAEHLPATPALWVLCGGGRKNPHIVADMRDILGQGAVALAEDLGFDGDAMEAEAWAYLAVRSARGLELTWPTTTGCRQPVTGGVLVRPETT